jgi:4-amino-4-deoxy-L-arabinose transferase-like glycosyltransferase
VVVPGLLLAAGWLAVLLATVEGVGCVRDEGYYFHAASLYLGWLERVWQELRGGGPLEALRQQVVDASWSYNPEHPALLKAAFGLSWRIFHQQLGWVSHTTGYRLPGMAMAALMVLFTWLLAARAHGRLVALGAVLLLATLPRLFHDSHLAALDVGASATSLLVVYCWWRALDDRRWALAAGAAFGMALATKHNAWFLPPVLAVHGALVIRGEPAGAPAAGSAARTAPRGSPFLALVAMAALGPLLLVAHWPHLWHDTAARLGAYLSFHLHHEHYPIEYLGRVLDGPPFPPGTWAFPFVMTAVTVPVATLVLMTVAVVRGVACEVLVEVRRPLARDAEANDPRRTRLLLLLAGLHPLVLIALPGVPIFGGVKHWFTAMPPLAILAAAELARLVRAVVARGRARTVAFAGVAVAAALTGALGIALVHPYGIGFYNELLGSVRGGAEHGMMRNFWGYASRGHLGYLNEHAQPGARVFFQRTNVGCYLAYQEEGLLRRDLRYAPSLDEADWALVFKQRTFDDDEYRIWQEWGTARPVRGVYVDEVPMVLLYRRGAPR